MTEEEQQALRALADQHEQLRCEYQRLQSKSRMQEEAVTECEEEIDRLRAENAALRSNNASSASISQQSVLSQLTAAEQERDSALANVAKLEERLRDLEKELADEKAEAAAMRAVFPFNESSISRDSADQEEIERLRNSLTEANEMIRKCELHHLDIECQLREAREREEGAIEEARMIQRDRDEAQEAIRCLEGQLFELQSYTKHAPKGNSMFSEFVTEREKIENDLRELFNENQNLRGMVKELEEERDELALQATGAKQMVEVKCKCGPLQAELVNLRNAIISAEQKAMCARIDFSRDARKATADVFIKKQLSSFCKDLVKRTEENERLRSECDQLKDKVFSAEVAMNVANQKAANDREELLRLRDLQCALRYRRTQTLTLPATGQDTALSSKATPGGGGCAPISLPPSSAIPPSAATDRKRVRVVSEGHGDDMDEEKLTLQQKLKRLKEKDAALSAASTPAPSSSASFSSQLTSETVRRRPHPAKRVAQKKVLRYHNDCAFRYEPDPETGKLVRVGKGVESQPAGGKWARVEENENEADQEAPSVASSREFVTSEE